MKTLPSLRRGYGLGAAGLLAVALLPPVATLAHGTLFSVHMLQHLILLLGVPALALLAWDHRETKRRDSLPAPAGRRRAACTFRVSPIVGWAAGTAGMWVWHIPALCNAAARVPSVQIVQTVSLLGLGLLFWWPLLGGAAGRISPLGGVAYLFAGCISCTLQGIVLTFSPVEICSAYLAPADPLQVLPWLRSRWGFTPSADQQIGGLIMWVPACLVYLGAIMGQFARWYGAAGARATLS